MIFSSTSKSPRGNGPNAGPLSAPPPGPGLTNPQTQPAKTEPDTFSPAVVWGTVGAVACAGAAAAGLPELVGGLGGATLGFAAIQAGTQSGELDKFLNKLPTIPAAALTIGTALMGAGAMISVGLALTLGVDSLPTVSAALAAGAIGGAASAKVAEQFD